MNHSNDLKVNQTLRIKNRWIDRHNKKIRDERYLVDMNNESYCSGVPFFILPKPKYMERIEL